MYENKPIWQQREDLSFTNLDLSDAKRERDIVKQIISRQQSSWSKLSLESEAKIQRLLRQQGYEILCYGLDTFPTSTADMASYLRRLSWLEIFKIKIQLLQFNLKNINVTGIVAFTVLCFGLVYFWNPTSILYALLLTYFVCNCIIVIVHEGWSHDYVTPKNRVIGALLDLIAYFYFVGKTRIGWKYIHVRHHQHWKQDDDQDQEAIDNTPYWAYLLFGSISHRKYPKPTDPTDDEIEHQCRVLNEKYKNQLLPESIWLEKYSIFIKILLHTFFIVLAGIENYFYFVYLQCWVFAMYFRLFNELIPHKNNLTKDQEIDHPALFPICTGVAYHSSHHRYGGYIIFGTDSQRRYNIQYYFIRLFYNIKAKVYTF